MIALPASHRQARSLIAWLVDPHDPREVLVVLGMLFGCRRLWGRS